MLLDGSLNFVQPGAPLSLVAAAGVAVPSPNIIDLVGSGAGTPPGNYIGTRSVFGADTGLGDNRLLLACIVGTSFTTGNSATLNVQFQGAVDQGSGGAYQPGSWITLVETGAIAVANLVSGKYIARFDWPPAFPAATLPRFLRLNFAVASATNFTAGTIAFAGPTFIRDDIVFGAKNFTVA